MLIAKEGPQTRCGARGSGRGVSRLRRSNELRPVLPVLTFFSKQLERDRGQEKGGIVRFHGRDGQATRLVALAPAVERLIRLFGVLPHGAVPSVPLLSLGQGRELLHRRHLVHLVWEERVNPTAAVADPPSSFDPPMGRHTFRDAVGVRGVLLRGWDVEFSIDLIDPDVRRRPPAADVVADRRFPGVLDVVTRITGNDLRFLLVGTEELEPLPVCDQGSRPERIAVEPHSIHRQLLLR